MISAAGPWAACSCSNPGVCRGAGRAPWPFVAGGAGSSCCGRVATGAAPAAGGGGCFSGALGPSVARLPNTEGPLPLEQLVEQRRRPGHGLGGGLAAADHPRQLLEAFGGLRFRADFGDHLAVV